MHGYSLLKPLLVYTPHTQFLFEDYVVNGNMWNGSPRLDGEVLGLMAGGALSKWMEAPLYKVRRQRWGAEIGRDALSLSWSREQGGVECRRAVVGQGDAGAQEQGEGWEVCNAGGGWVMEAAGLVTDALYLLRPFDGTYQPASLPATFTRCCSQWDGRRYSVNGSVSRSPDERLYLASSLRLQSSCGGQCGWRWNATTVQEEKGSGGHSDGRSVRADSGYRHHWHDLPPFAASVGSRVSSEGPHQGQDGSGDDSSNNGGGGGPLLSGPQTLPLLHRRLVCEMPREQATRMVAFHHGCVLDGDLQEAKRNGMLTWQDWEVMDGAELVHMQQQQRRQQGSPGTGGARQYIPQYNAYTQQDEPLRAPSPIYIITPFSSSSSTTVGGGASGAGGGPSSPLDGLRQLLASLRFDLFVQWVIVHDTVNHNFKCVIWLASNRGCLVPKCPLHTGVHLSQRGRCCTQSLPTCPLHTGVLWSQSGRYWI